MLDSMPPQIDARRSDKLAGLVRYDPRAPHVPVAVLSLLEL